MKKFLLTLAMLSMTALAFVGCGEAKEVVSSDGDVDVTPAVEETTVTPTPAVETPVVPAETPAE